MTPETKGPPFSWQDKRVLKRIREEIEDYSSAVLVYVGLTVIASDKQAEEFRTTHSWIGQMTGLSEKTVRLRLGDLQRIGAVHITTPALRAPCTYRLLPFRNDGGAFGNGYRTFGNGYRAFGNSGGSPLPRSEESKNLRKETQKPISAVERISLDKKLSDLRQKRQRLREDTSEPWQRKQYPERLETLRALEAEIGELEARL